jgi:hypothetical protein
MADRSARQQRQHDGLMADDFAEACGAQLHSIAYQDMAVCRGPCRIVRWHLDHTVTGAQYDSFLTTIEYCDGSFTAAVDVDGKSWGDQVEAVKRAALAVHGPRKGAARTT